MGQSASFWRWPQFDLFICINIWKKLHVCNKRYVTYIDRISHAQWQHVSRKSTFNSRSQNFAKFAMWGKAPPWPMIPHNYSKWNIIVHFNSRHDCILYHACVCDCSYLQSSRAHFPRTLQATHCSCGWMRRIQCTETNINYSGNVLATWVT